ncbi:MAG TPA: M48 family metallopeptidase [Anaeromyxobacteraceae bacterium]|nr:M48 family metallopeptidase [Anaeromyxobacteraceae bacterium]
MSTLVSVLVVTFFSAELTIETVLSIANLRHTRRVGGVVPPLLAGELDLETARRSRDYAVAGGRFDLVRSFAGVAFTLLLLFSGILPALDSALFRHRVLGAHHFVAFLVALFALCWLFSLPFSLYGMFVLEARFGFNRAGTRLWVKDKLKGLLVAAALGIPLLYATYGFFSLAARAWWLYLFAFLAAFEIAMIFVYPAVIAPFFNDFSPLPDGDLKVRLEQMARRAGFRTRGVVVIDASRRSSHSNAYFAGFFRPRIVLFDTLLAQMSTEETAAVLAHEIGHYQARHVPKALAVGLFGLFASLWGLSLLVAWPPLFAAFGFAAPSFHAAVALVSLCGGAFTFFLTPLASFLSRRHEYEADRCAVAISGAPHALRSALVKLNQGNLGNVCPHPWYSAWHYSHPPLLERMAAIEADDHSSR